MNKQEEGSMKNTLNDLNNYLFEAIERLQDDEQTGTEEKLEMEIKRSEAVAKVAGTIIQNADIQLKAIKHADEYGYSGERKMPALLVGGEENGPQ